MVKLNKYKILLSFFIKLGSFNKIFSIIALLQNIILSHACIIAYEVMVVQKFNNDHSSTNISSITPIQKKQLFVDFFSNATGGTQEIKINHPPKTIRNENHFSFSLRNNFLFRPHNTNTEITILNPHELNANNRYRYTYRPSDLPYTSKFNNQEDNRAYMLSILPYVPDIYNNPTGIYTNTFKLLVFQQIKNPSKFLLKHIGIFFFLFSMLIVYLSLLPVFCFSYLLRENKTDVFLTIIGYSKNFQQFIIFIIGFFIFFLIHIPVYIHIIYISGRLIHFTLLSIMVLFLQYSHIACFFNLFDCITSFRVHPLLIIMTYFLYTATYLFTNEYFSNSNFILRLLCSHPIELKRQLGFFLHFNLDNYINIGFASKPQTTSYLLSEIIFTILTTVSMLMVSIYISNYSSLKEFYESILQLIKNNSEKVYKDTETEGRGGLVIRGLSKVYGNGDEKVTALEKFSLHIPNGEKAALLGANGAGKTTFFECVMGLCKITTGEIFFNRKRIFGTDGLAGKIGYCPQESFFISILTVEENLGLFDFKSPLKESDKIEIINMLDLTSCLKKLPGILSGGQKRKLSFYIAIITCAPLIILDEPTTGVDALSKKMIKKILFTYCKNSIVLLASHLVEDLEGLSSKIVFFSKGKLLGEGTKADLIKQFNVQGSTLIVYKDCCLDLSKEFSNKLEEVVGHMVEVPKDTSLRVSIQLPHLNPLKLATIYEELETIKSEFSIRSFSIQTVKVDEIIKKVEGKTISPVQHLGIENKLNDNNMKNRLFSFIYSRAYKNFCILKSSNNIRLVSIFFLILTCLLTFGTRNNMPGKSTYDMDNQALVEELTNNTEIIFNDSLKIELDELKESTSLKNLKTTSFKEFKKKKLSNIKKYLFFIRQYENEDIEKIKSMKEINEALEYEHIDRYGLRHYVDVIIYNNSRLPIIKKLFESDSKEKNKLEYEVDLTSLNYSTDIIKQLLFGYIPLSSLFFLIPLIGIVLVDLYGNSGISVETTFGHRTHSIYLFDFLFFSFVLLLPSMPFLLIFFPSGVYFTSFLIIFSLNILVCAFASFSNPLIACSLINFLVVLSIQIRSSVTPLSKAGFTIGSKIIDWRYITGKFFILFIPFISISFFTSLSSLGISRGLFKTILEPKEVILANPYERSYNLFGKYALTVIGNIAGSFILLVVGSFRILQLLNFIISYSFKKKAIRRAIKNDKTDNVIQDLDPSRNVLVFKKVSKVYGFLTFSHNVALKRLSLSVKKGSTVGILGSNGGGKSTAFSIATGNLLPEEGYVSVRGERSRLNIVDRIAVCFQDTHMSASMTTIQILTYYSLMTGKSYRVAKEFAINYITLLGLFEHMNKRFGELSGGSQRKVAIAVAFIHKSELMILDEPTTGVDMMSCEGIWDYLNNSTEKDRSVLLASHSMLETEKLCDEIAVLVRGRLIDLGTSEELKRKYGKYYLVSVLLVDKEVIFDKETLKRLRLGLGADKCELKSDKEANFFLPKKGSISEAIREVYKVITEKHKHAEFEVIEEGLEEILSELSKSG